MRIFTIIFTVLVVLFLPCNGQKKRLFDYNEGLSNSLINEVYQDHQGFIWIATEDGLNRFDGIKFKTYPADPSQPQALKDNFVTAIYEDSHNNLWIGLVNGLQYFQHETESFINVDIHINNQQIHPYISDICEAPNGDIWIGTSAYGLIKIDHKNGRPHYSTRLNKKLCSMYLECLFMDSDGLLWIGSDNNGMSCYNTNTGDIQNFSPEKAKPFYLPANDITAICEDENKDILIGSLKSGLIKYHKQTQATSFIASEDPKEKKLPVKSLLLDDKKRVWVGTDGKGLRRLNLQGKLEKMHPGSSSFDFSKSKVHSIVQDNIGNIWLGIFQKGLYLFPESAEMFNHYGYKAFSQNSIGSNSITALSGHADVIYIGTDGDGIYQMKNKTQQIQHLSLKDENKEYIGNNVLSLFDSNDGYLWIGTFFNGLLKYNTHNKQLTTYKNKASNTQSLVNDKVTAIKSYKNELWLATLGGGICSFNPQKQTFTAGLHLINDSLNQLIPKWVNDIYIDPSGNFWIASYDGLFLINIEEQKLVSFNPQNKRLPHKLVYCIQGDSENNIWVGTYNGLVKIQSDHLQSTSYTTNDGLGSNVICSIVEDDYKQIWVSTHKGLSRYNPQDSTFVSYYASDGLQANEFSRNAVYKTGTNKIYFGGINGISEIKKDYFNYKRNIRDVILTEFTLNNKSVNIGEKTGKHTILNRSIVVADTIQLRENDNVFTIGFTSVELAHQSRISYEYKMDGFDTHWNKSNPLSRNATYTNLPHGIYHFYVRAVDKNQYTQPRVLTIIIHPPWYKTIFAKILWVLMAFAFFYGIILFSKEKVLRLEAEKTNEKKMQFFINISHEIKTPLTLIIDPLEKLLRKRNNDENLRLYKTMHTNANRIYRLVSQLLDVRKIDKGQLLVKFQKTNLFTIVTEIAESYNMLAESKNIVFSIHCDNKDIEVWIDPLNFEKVILNLLSNAFKYTNGEVSIDINEYSSYAQIAVSDNGNGIKKGDIEKIFHRFYQSASNENRNITGTGIGLHLSRSLVALHKGTLTAENRKNQPGARFIIHLPLGNEHLPQKDLIIEETRLPLPTINYSSIKDEAEINHNQNVSLTPSSNYKIMIVDDEEEIRDYLKQELKGTYTLTVCIHGKDALLQLDQFKPDLIISDIMMPEMDGISFCKKIKGNIETSHIPVILLTALSKEEDKAEGIDTGADMYLVKPFNSQILKKTIANLLENRRKIHQQIQAKNGNGYNVETIKLKSNDEILMQKVMAIVKENISNSDLNVEMLADGVGISRVHMHRKLKELTNLSARDFIKNIRMKQAAYILTTKKINISEVAYAVGYSNLSHFSNTFKSYYRISPKEYIKGNQMLKVE